MYDLVIVGAGSAGLTAAIYACCYHLQHIVISTTLGGQLEFAPDILNYPGFLSISGKELTQHFVEQAKARGSEIVLETAISVDKNPQAGFTTTTKSGQTYISHAVIIATGTERRKLNIPGENEYVAKGVRYCVTCEKPDYGGQTCAIVGGANSAVAGAVHLAQIAKKVSIIYRGSELRGDPIWLDKIKELPQIEVVYQTVITEIKGDGEKVTGVKLKNNVTNTESELAVDKVFIKIGGVPGSALVAKLGVDRDPGGYIRVDNLLSTNIPGIFAAGDLVTHEYSIEQISTAVGLGARAATSAFSYIKGVKAPSVWGSSQIPR